MSFQELSATKTNLPIAVDAMGGDLGPGVVVEGALRAWKELGIRSILVGKEGEIRAKLASFGASSSDAVRVQGAEEVITMEDSPSAAIRGKTDSSIRVAFELVKNGKASAVISPGNTGAVMAAGLYVSGTLPGIARPAIATLIPRVGELRPTIMLDSGANTDCHAQQLVHFGLMGCFYAKATGLYQNPRIALLSNGTESSKGNDIIRAAYAALSDTREINFVGYVEGRDIAKNVADVVVCDGFVGNITLKTMEGAVELALDSLKHYTPQSLRWQIGMHLAKPMFKLIFKEKLDPSTFGGAPLLGLREVAIISHGSANGRAIMNGIRVAMSAVEGKLVEKIGAALSHLETDEGGAFQDGIWDRIGKRFEKQKKKGDIIPIEYQEKTQKGGND